MSYRTAGNGICPSVRAAVKKPKTKSPETFRPRKSWSNPSTYPSLKLGSDISSEPFFNPARR